LWLRWFCVTAWDKNENEVCIHSESALDWEVRKSWIKVISCKIRVACHAIFASPKVNHTCYAALAILLAQRQSILVSSMAYKWIWGCTVLRFVVILQLHLLEKVHKNLCSFFPMDVRRSFFVKSTFALYKVWTGLPFDIWAICA